MTPAQITGFLLLLLKICLALAILGAGRKKEPIRVISLGIVFLGLILGTK